MIGSIYKQGRSSHWWIQLHVNGRRFRFTTYTSDHDKAIKIFEFLNKSFPGDHLSDETLRNLINEAMEKHCPEGAAILDLKETVKLLNTLEREVLLLELTSYKQSETRR